MDFVKSLTPSVRRFIRWFISFNFRLGNQMSAALEYILPNGCQSKPSSPIHPSRTCCFLWQDIFDGPWPDCTYLRLRNTFMRLNMAPPSHRARVVCLSCAILLFISGLGCKAPVSLYLQVRKNRYPFYTNRIKFILLLHKIRKLYPLLAFCNNNRNFSALTAQPLPLS